MFLATIIVIGAVMVKIAVVIVDHLQTSIKPQQEYAGLRVGTSPEEVIYIKGYPRDVLGGDIKEGEFRDSDSW